jgi:hypothetical protein
MKGTHIKVKPSLLQFMTTLKSLVLDPDCMDYGVVDQIFQKEQKSQRTLTVWEKHRLDVVTIQNAAADPLFKEKKVWAQDTPNLLELMGYGAARRESKRVSGKRLARSRYH